MFDVIKSFSVVYKQHTHWLPFIKWFVPVMQHIYQRVCCWSSFSDPNWRSSSWLPTISRRVTSWRYSSYEHFCDVTLSWVEFCRYNQPPRRKLTIANRRRRASWSSEPFWIVRTASFASLGYSLMLCLTSATKIF